MPTQFSALDNSFPSFTGQESVEQKVEALYNYTFMLLENLRYVLRNLSTENFNEPDLKKFISSITDPINVTINDVEEGLQTAIDIQAGRITQEVSKSGTGSLGEGETLFSRITQNAEEIELRVEKNGVISSINQSAESIVISAGKVDLSGKVSFSDLSTAGHTSIIGDNITSGTITGVTLVSDDGTQNAKTVRIEDGGIQFGVGNANYGELTAAGGLGDVYYNIGAGCRLIVYPGVGGGHLELASKTVLRENVMYGTTLPASGYTGQVFFLI